MIDLYQIHWPSLDIPISETMRAMETLVSEGKVRFIGVSNFSTSQMKAAQDSLQSNPLVSNQVKYSLFAREIEDDILPYCQENGITVIAYTPLGRGNFNTPDDTLRKEAEAIGKNPAQVLLNWVVAYDGVMAIPKTDKPDRVDEAAEAVGFTLSEESREVLERMV